MTILAKNTASKDFDAIPEGSYVARIYQVLHLGTFPDYTGVLKNKINITFELPTELAVFNVEKGEQPRVISQDYTLSFHEKSTLRKIVKACDPLALKIGDDGLVADYDVENLLGKTCLVTVIHKDGKEGKVFANVGSVTVLPKGMVCPPQVNESKSLSYDNFDNAFFSKLPKFLQDKIISSEEYKFMKFGDTPKDDVPFN